MTPLLKISDLEIDIGDEARPTHVLRGARLEVEHGEVVGLVGESGCGKTTTMLAVAGLLSPSARIRAGSISLAGRDLLGLKGRAWRTVRGREVACVFQNARNALHPMMTIGSQIARLHRLHQGHSAEQAWTETVALLERVGLAGADRLAHRCPHELSGGQCQRAMIAMALTGRPKLLLADEPTSGLDVTVQRQVLATLLRTVREEGTAMVLISHDLGVIGRTCDSVSVMYAGEMVESGRRDDVLESPEHPYTQALLAALRPTGRRMSHIPGQVPDLRQAINQCSFADRCPLVLPECRDGRPVDVRVADGHLARCVRVKPASPDRRPIKDAMC